MSALNPVPAQLDLISEPENYHDSERWGWFSVLARQSAEGGRLRQSSYRLNQLPSVIQAAPRDRDCYISQGEFSAPNRRVVNLARIGLLFLDIDPGPITHLDGDQWAMRCLMACKDEGIPAPSLIVFSGRGVHLKWLLSTPVPRQALIRWNLAQRNLVERFEYLGADAGAKDASRVLRLEGTRNSKSGEVCRVVWEDRGTDGDLVRYGFDELFDELVDMPREALKETIKQREASRGLKVIKGGLHGLRKLSQRTLAWDRLEDLRTLAKMRAHSIEGQRMLFLHWSINFLALAEPIKASHLHYEARTLAAELAPGWSYRDCDLSTQFAKAKAHAKGEKVEFNGRMHSPLYTPWNSTLINTFQITDDEQRQLKTIVSKAEAKRRDAERKREQRRKAGAIERNDYLRSMTATTEQRREVAFELREQGKTNKEIAEALSIHIKSVPRLLKR
jgi:hypothetical protein|tara:strand:- start:12769 stop:14109 length:1341 start_codon:yes stop_codon:yes gene_type:complete